MSAAQVLKHALSLISEPNAWVRNAMAVDAFGLEVDPKSEKAKCFCMVGALQRVPSSTAEYGAAIRLLRSACNGQSIYDFNDTHGHPAVTKAMKRAIRAAETA